MWDFGDAERKVLDVASEWEKALPERVYVGRAAGRVLAEEVVSPVNLPAYDYSAMDGYAVSVADFQGATTLTLPVSGECRTGHSGPTLSPGHCLRIFTGARIPAGADAVVMQENVERSGDQATFVQVPRPGDHIRRAGEDLKKGEVVLTRGTRLSPLHLGLLASAERSEVLVAARPHVTILCTGDELRAPGAAGGHDAIVESNGLALCAAVDAVGGAAQRGPLVPDDLAAMRAALSAAVVRSDVIITVGGVSVGDHDLVAPALEQLGAEVYFHKVRIKPGKPVLFARLGSALVLGLPGNPSSAQVTFALFGIPLVRALQGDSEPTPARRMATLSHDVSQKPGRRAFCRARLTGDQVALDANQASGASTALAWGNALAVLSEDTESFPAGTTVPVLSYNDLFG